MVRYFFDSYALVELSKGNPNFALFTNEIVVLTLFNLAEMYWAVLRDFGKDKADRVYAQFRDCIVDVDDATLKEAMHFKLEHKQKRLSYADCIGYQYALRYGLSFLTGDIQFKTLPHVTFVPA